MQDSPLKQQLRTRLHHSWILTFKDSTRDKRQRGGLNFPTCLELTSNFAVGGGKANTLYIHTIDLCMLPLQAHCTGARGGGEREEKEDRAESAREGKWRQAWLGNNKTGWERERETRSGNSERGRMGKKLSAVSWGIGWRYSSPPTQRGGKGRKEKEGTAALPTQRGGKGRKEKDGTAALPTQRKGEGRDGWTVHVMLETTSIEEIVLCSPWTYGIEQCININERMVDWVVQDLKVKKRALWWPSVPDITIIYSIATIERGQIHQANPVLTTLLHRSVSLGEKADMQL